MLGPVDVHFQASSAEVDGHLPVRALVLKAELAFELVDDISQMEYWWQVGVAFVACLLLLVA